MSRQILVCDDEPHILRAISLKLTRAGFDLKNVTEVETCWRLLQRDDIPALLIVDQSFATGPDGVDLVGWVRQDSRLADLPVLMLGNPAELANQREALAELKLAQVISKPFSPRELVEEVNRLLGQSDTSVRAPHAGAYRTSDCKL